MTSLTIYPAIGPDSIVFEASLAQRSFTTASRLSHSSPTTATVTTTTTTPTPTLTTHYVSSTTI